METNWKEIGEFVEGQDNLNIVVRQTYDDNWIKSIFYEIKNEVNRLKINDTTSRAGEEEGENELTAIKNLTES